MVWKLQPTKPTAGEQDMTVNRTLGHEKALEINFESQPEELPESGLAEPEVTADLPEHGQQIGLVGYPNAGKSTLLSAISSAQPKIAAYPFTTLHPNIGIVEFADYSRLIVCDIPGIVDGAHDNVGLGHAFLRHILRCRVLVLLIDMAGIDEREPWDDYKQLLNELELYDPALLNRPRLVAANKMDEAVAPEKLKEFRSKLGQVDIVEISAAFDLGLEELKNKMQQIVAATSED